MAPSAQRTAARLANFGLEERHLAAAEPLITGQQAGEDLFTVSEGVLIATIDAPNGKSRISAIYYPGDIVLPGGTDGSRAETITAAIPTRLAAYPLKSVRRACATEPDIGYELFETACQDFSRRIIGEVVLRGMSVEERLAAVILEMGQRLGTPLGAGIELVLPITRAQIGNYLSLRSETICRIFARWKQRGLIALRGRRVIEIRRPAELREVIGDAAGMVAGSKSDS